MSLHPRLHLLLLLTLTLLTPSISAAEGPAPINFAVTLGDRPLGTHEVRFEETADGLLVQGRTALRFRLAFVTLFRYEHEVQELWHDGCLVDLRSNTDDNGKSYAVETVETGLPLTLLRYAPKTKEPQRTVTEGCSGTFAYWDPRLLERQALINAQTGQAEAIKLVKLGEELKEGKRLRHLVLEFVEDPAIHLWYDEENRWRRLETQTERGLLVYAPEA